MTRYSKRPFPTYRHRPGRTPHPERDPEGHSYREREPEVRPLTESSCRENEEFLYAVDLFNAGFWWEAHVAWERLWHLARPESSERRFLAGLIQLAASCLKHEMGNPKGAEKLYARSQKHHRHLEPRRQFGVDLDALASAARAYFASETPELTLHLDV